MEARGGNQPIKRCRSPQTSVRRTRTLGEMPPALLEQRPKELHVLETRLRRSQKAALVLLEPHMSEFDVAGLVLLKKHLGRAQEGAVVMLEPPLTGLDPGGRGSGVGGVAGEETCTRGSTRNTVVPTEGRARCGGVGVAR